MSNVPGGMNIFDRLVTAMEQMVGAFAHAQVMVPALAGLDPMVKSMRMHVQEARNLMRPPEPPVVQPEDPPKIEDIHGELPPTPVPDEPPVVPDAPDVPAPVDPAPPVPDTPPDVPPPAEPQPDHS